MKITRMARWRRNFFTGLAVVLPAVASIGIVWWLFGTVSNFTDTLLFFLPKEWTHRQNGLGEMHVYYKLAAFALAILLISLIGSQTRNFVGRKVIMLFDQALLRIPLLNKIYSTIKQVNDAFSSSKKSAFKQVVLVQFPKDGMYSLGFLTGDQHDEVQDRTKEKVISAFVPTTPNPTTGFLILVPENDVIRLNMSVAEGIRFIISLGSVVPEYRPQLPPPALAAILGKPVDRPAQVNE